MLPKFLLAAAVAAVVLPASAHAAVTHTSVLAPANPYYRVYQPELKADDKVDVSGTSDGRAGDLVDIVCTTDTSTDELLANVKVGDDGRFAASIGIKAFSSRECTLRALPNKLRPQGLDAFGGPRVAITFFSPDHRRIAVSGTKEPAVLDYRAMTGRAELSGAGTNALAQDVWHVAAALGTQIKDERNAIEVDGRAAYSAGDVPLLESDGRPLAPAGYDGVHATIGLDQRTNDVTVTETERIVRCDGKCANVLDTGVRLVRTVAFTEHHAVADVRDQWVSTDGRPHTLRLAYTHAAAQAALAQQRSLWRFPGNPAFLPYERGQSVAVSGPGTLLVRPPDAAGSLTYDPAPARFAFPEYDELLDVVEVSTPSTVTRTFTVGDVTIADRRGAPKVTIEGPAHGAILTQPRVTVFGRASDNLGVQALTVNGRPVPLKEDGSYNTALDLALGNTRITVTATDGAGQSTSASADVTVVETLTPPRPQPARGCTVPSIKRGATLKSVKAKLAKANCRPPRKLTKQRSSKVRKGRVIALTRKAGTNLKGGTRIGIKVSSGRKR